MTPPYDQQANRKAAWRWGSLVVGLLTLQIAIGVFAFVLATRDDSANVIIPDYYQKALNWDDDVALRQASSLLGWQLKLDTTAGPDESTGLVMELTDKQGVPISIASGRLEWYRHARANEIRSATIPNHPGGMFTIDACFEAGGLWQVVVDVTDTGGNRFADSRVIDLSDPTLTADSGAT